MQSALNSTPTVVSSISDEEMSGQYNICLLLVPGTRILSNTKYCFVNLSYVTPDKTFEQENPRWGSLSEIVKTLKG